MATISEFNSFINLFVEAVQVLQSDKSEVTAAQEALSAAQAALTKEEADVGGSKTTLNGAWEQVKVAGDSIVAELMA
jgi:hypothetical protein